jgi:hypothetical protein
VSLLIGSPFANWFALAFPVASPQLPHPFFSTHSKALFALLDALFG